jgi:hypothetical protein
MRPIVMKFSKRIRARDTEVLNDARCFEPSPWQRARLVLPWKLRNVHVCYQPQYLQRYGTVKLSMKTCSMRGERQQAQVVQYGDAKQAGWSRALSYHENIHMYRFPQGSQVEIYV